MRFYYVVLAVGLACGLAIGYLAGSVCTSFIPTTDRQNFTVQQSKNMLAARYQQRGRTERFFERSAPAKRCVCPVRHAGPCQPSNPQKSGLQRNLPSNNLVKPA
ncbi:MAG: hypothetical protein ACYC3X_20215 [Pirellulaceae bacterium]